MEKGSIFSYSWYIDDKEKDATVIRIYGLDKDNKNICVVIKNFTPYAYVELPSDIDWDESKAQLVANKIDNMMGDKKPLIKYLTYKYKLYYAELDKDYNRKKYPYLFCAFSNQDDSKFLSGKIRYPMTLPGMGRINLKLHEFNASPILQLTSLRKLPTAGWIDFCGKRVADDDKQTHCDSEFVVSWKNLQPASSISVARPLLMGYDIEVNSSIPSSMPNADRKDDKIFQISCVFGRQGSKLETYKKFLLTLGKPDLAVLKNDDVHTIEYGCESDLINGFTDLIQKYQPNIIIGYNIFGFDIPYMINRSKYLYCMDTFDQQGLLKSAHAKERLIEWNSSAYKNQSFEFLDAEGRLFIDLLPLVKRDYKLSNYRLKTIASHFLKDMTKDPLDAQGIFKCYKLGMEGGKKGERALSLVGKYCVKDSLLVVRLFEVLTTWVALCEMSKVCNVPIFSLYTQGQQLKVFSQTYKKCTHDNIVVEKDAYIPTENDHYAGAIVFPPVPGLYDKVVPFDFCLSGDTYINTEYGYSVKITDMIDNIDVHGWNGTKFELCDHQGIISKGTKDTIKIYIDDGTTITTTPEHKFMLSNGDWCEAENLKDKYVKCGIIQPRDIQCDKEKDWNMLNFNMKTPKDRINTLSLARVLGTKNINTPKFLLDKACPKSIIREYLASLFDRATINFHNIELLVSYDINILCHLLKSFDITPDICDKTLSISSNDFKTFADNIGFRNNLINSYDLTVFISYTKFLENNEYCSLKSYMNQIRYNRDSLTMDKKVVNIEKDSRQPVYDILNVDTYHNFLAEGIVVSNCSLYPTTIIAHNICWSTLVKDESIPDSKCHVMDFEDHIGCDHDPKEIRKKQLIEIIKKGENEMKNYREKRDERGCINKEYYKNLINEKKEELKPYREERAQLQKSKPKNIICAKRHFRWLKEPMGVLPEILTHLLDTRSSTKKEMKNMKAQLKTMNPDDEKYSELETYIDVLDQRQLALKVSANSAYGAMGVKRGYLPFMPGAMCTTYKGRKSIERAAESIQKDHKGILVYGDTDSNYISFPHLKTAKECWDYSVKVAQEVTKLFPKPMSLAFEEKIYWLFFLITKKRYMSIECEQDGKLSEKISKKGVLLQRRDNCEFARNIYAAVTMMIFEKKTFEEIISFIIDEFNKMYSRVYDYTKFIITKSIGKIELKYEPVKAVNNKGKECYKLGDYTVKKLDEDNRAVNMKNKKCQNEYCSCTTGDTDRIELCPSCREYYLKSLPAQAQLAEKMRERGQIVAAGSRIEYVITTMGGLNAKQYEKVEDADYFKKHSSVLNIDYLYYHHQISKPLDQILEIVFKDRGKNFVFNHYNDRVAKFKLTEKIQQVFQPQLKFI